MNKEEIEDYKKLSAEITENLDNTSTYESWLIIQEYIDRQQQELNKKNKIIEEIKTLIENYKHLCKDKGLNMNLTISMIEDILIPKGSEE